MSLCCCFPVGVGSLCCQPAVHDYCEMQVREVTSEGDEVERTLQLGGWDKTLIFQAIPNTYAGRDPWVSFGARAVHDCKFKVVFQGGISKLGLIQIG
jgi:hypothetical protein